MKKDSVARWLTCSLLANLLLATATGYLWLRYQDRGETLQAVQKQEAGTRQALLQGQLEYQALLSARDSLQTRLLEQDKRLAEQAQQLVLYRQVLAPDGAKELMLTEGEITPLPEEGKFKFRLVLLQPEGQGTRITGQARIRVQVRQQGEIVSLSEQELGLAPLLLDFQHFQILAGSGQLPVGAEGRQLELLLELGGRSDKTFRLAWPLPGNT
ncbi:DUF6776 family protein [Zobellella maritima]|uniref:DUF6776 family protein n=1 Tax=Zobellella maritima TaxID=2059725 RepID=UPI000E307565|nr:DUF6776 family protein [Zobellella maritima]